MSATCSVPAPALSVSKISAERSRSLSYRGAVALGVRLCGAAGVFVTHVVLARTLGVSKFGEYALAITWMQTLTVVAKLGLDNASLRFVSEYMTTGETGRLRAFVSDSNRVCFWASGLASSCLMAASILFRNRLGDGLAGSLFVASLMIPLLAHCQIQEATLRSVGRLLESQISVAVWPLLLSLLTVIVVGLTTVETTSTLATVLHMCSFGTTYLMVRYFVSKSQLLRGVGSDGFVLAFDEQTRLRRIWVGTAMAFFMAEALIAVKSRACVAAAGMLLGADAVGLYSAMERITDVTVLGSQSLGIVIAPQFASLFSAGRYSEMRRVLWKGLAMILLSTIPVAIGLAVFRNAIFSLVGDSYRDGSTVLIMLLIAACIASTSGPGAYILQMTGRERTMLLITAVSAGANLLLGLILMPVWGLFGLGIAQIGTSLIWTFCIWFGLRDHPIWQSECSITQITEGFIETGEPGCVNTRIPH